MSLDQFVPVQRTSVPQGVADQLLEMMRRGKLKPGDQLPTERELADRLGVGRSSVREAMQMLTTLNVVEARAGAGTFVRRPKLADILRPQTLGLLTGNMAAMELLEAREMIEPNLARLAAERGTEADFARIDELLDEHGRALAAGEPVSRHAARFHHLVAAAAHNDIAAVFIESILGLLMARGRRKDWDRGNARAELAEHQALQAVLRARDPDRAGEAMLEHIVASAASYDTGQDQPDGVAGAAFES